MRKRKLYLSEFINKYISSIASDKVTVYDSHENKYEFNDFEELKKWREIKEIDNTILIESWAYTKRFGYIIRIKTYSNN